MATKKQKRAAGLVKREKFLAEDRAIGLRAKQASRKADLEGMRLEPSIESVLLNRLFGI